MLVITDRQMLFDADRPNGFLQLDWTEVKVNGRVMREPRSIFNLGANRAQYGPDTECVSICKESRYIHRSVASGTVSADKLATAGVLFPIT